MSYVGIDTQGARALAQVLQDTAGRVDGLRQSVSAALDLADLASQAPAQLARVHDGFTTLAAGVTDKAALAEQFAMDPAGTAARLDAPVNSLGTALRGLLGLGGPADLRSVLVGLPIPGADPALDGALARLNPVLLPALLAGQRPELTEAQAADLKSLALALGITHAGPPVAPVAHLDEMVGALLGGSWPAGPLFRGVQEKLVAAIRPQGRTGTEVFWNDFWADGRTVDTVLADPALLLQWVAGTFELDRRLALAPGLPTLGDVLTSVDFATTSSDPGQLAAMLATAETEFAAIAEWLPMHLVGLDPTGPDATQLAQTLAFASRVGWPDPGAGAASDQARFADAIAFLRANRALQSALLPTGFEGDGAPLAFLNQTGIGFVLDLGLRTGVLDATVVESIAGTVDQAMAAFGVDLTGPVPATLTEQFQQQLVALLATQIPRSALEAPATQAQFIAALGYLRQAVDGPAQRQRLIEILAAFRTLAVTGAPALTERQLVAAVGTNVLDVLGRSRLRLRSEAAVRGNPEFLLVARQWGVPTSRTETIGKYKFSWSFNDLGELTGIGRKKRSWLSRAWDTVKAVGQAIWQSWEDNPLKAIFQVGKIALGALAFVVPGLQGLGAAAFAASVAETAYHAIEGDWLSAIGSGLAAFTAGAADIFSPAAATIVETAQHSFASSLLDANTLSFLKDARRAFDIGTSIFRATQADSLVGAIGAGLGAAVTTLGSGGQLLGSLDLADKELVRDLSRIGLSMADVSRLVTPAAGLVDALDRGSVLAAFGNGLSVLAAGARVVINPAGAFAGAQPPLGGVFQFDQETQAALGRLAQGAGVAGGVSLAIDAANRGNTFQAGTFLAQAVQVLNDPRTPVNGSRAQVAERIAEIGVLLEAVHERRASATAVAPLVVQRLTRLLDSLNTPPPRPITTTTGRAPAARTTPVPARTLIPPAGIVLTSGPLGPDPTALRPVTRTVVPEAEAFAALGDGGDGLPPDVSEVSRVASLAAFPAPMRLGGPMPSALLGGPTETGSPGPEAFAGSPALVLAGFDSRGEIQPLLGTGFTLTAASGDNGTRGGTDLAQMPTPRAEFVTRPRVTIAVIGNSYTSGEGGDLSTYERVDVPFAGMTVSMIHPAHRSSQAAAMQVIERLRAQHPDVDFEVRFVAVSGATPGDILHTRTNPDTPFEARPQVEAAGDQFNARREDYLSMADIVILGEGGNPRFRNVVNTVIWPGNAATPEMNATLLNQLSDGEFRDEQKRVQGQVLSRMNPAGTLIVLGYPRVLPDVIPPLSESYNPFSSSFGPVIGSVLYTGEAQMVNSFTFEINRQIEGAADINRLEWGNRTIVFANPHGVFAEHYLFSANPAVHGVDLNLSTGYDRSFHPTPFGYGLLADFLQPYIGRAVQNAIDRQRPPAAPETPLRRGEAEEPPAEDGQPSRTRLTSAETPAEEPNEGLTVPAGITLAGSTVGGDSFMESSWATPYLTGGLANLATTNYFTGDLANLSPTSYFTGDLANLSPTSYFTGDLANLSPTSYVTGDWASFNAASYITADLANVGDTDYVSGNLDLAADWSTVDSNSYT